MDKPETPDRRRFRYAVKPRPFVVMTGSGGILRDVSDEGLAIDVVGPSLTTKRFHFNFDISETGEHFEGLGEIIWKNEPGNKIGIRFVDLPDASRHKFRSWLSTKSESALNSKNANLQNRGKAKDPETHLWMRPRADASGPSEVLNSPEETRSTVPAFNYGLSAGNTMEPAMPRQYSNVTSPKLDESHSISLSAHNISAIEKEFEVVSFPHFVSFAAPELKTSEWPGTGISATSPSLESAEKVVPSVLPGRSATTSETEFKSIPTPHMSNVAIPNDEINRPPGTESSTKSALPESAEEEIPLVFTTDGGFTPENEFKSVSPPHFTSAAITNAEISEWPNTESSTTSTPDLSESSVPPLWIETEFASIPSREDGAISAPKFDTQAWLRPRIHVSPMTNYGDKMEPAANAAPHTSESDPSLANVEPSDEVVEPVQTDVRFSFNKILTAKRNLDPEIDQVAAARNWQYLFRWVFAGATVCLGILAVGLGIRLSEDQLITSTAYRTVRAFFLDTFTPSNAAPLAVHNVPTSVSAHSLHLSKELKTSRVRVTDPAPSNKPMVPTKYEVLDAKTGRRYFPHTGTNVAVNFVRIQEEVGEDGPGSRTSAGDAKLFSGSQVELGDGKIGKVSQKSSGELPVKEVIPEYPPLALQKSVQGRVALSAIITTDGSLRDVRVVGSPSMLDNAALSAVKEWRYQAHYENGKPVEVEIQIFVDFSISIEK
jgi:TonB family protein